jgi:hypothetical protein
MWSIPKFQSDNSKLLANILAEANNREEMLGMKPPVIPTPDGIRVDAAKILKYTDSNSYKKFADEAWARVIEGLDKILNPKTTRDQRDFYCGEVNATLNLLRLSYQAKEIVTQDAELNASLQQDSRKANRPT